MTQVYLIRHGEAANNVGTNIGAGGPLTERGVRQAQRLRDRLAATGEIHAGDPSGGRVVLIASTMRRAQQTAEIIAPALGLTPISDGEVEERRVGDADGLTRDAALGQWPMPDYSLDPRAPWIPGSETPYVFTARISRALTRITAEHAGKTIVIVCHGGFIAGAFLFFQGLDTVATAGGGGIWPLPEHHDLIGRPWTLSYHILNTSITHWRLHARPAGRVGWRLESANDAFHLRSLDSDVPLDWSTFAGRPAAEVVAAG